MTGLDIFGIVIAMVFVYLLLSLLATTLNEWFMMILNARGESLRVAIETMLRDGKGKEEALNKLFFQNPMFKKLTIGENLTRMPSYLSNAMFTQIILDTLTDGKNYQRSIEEITFKIEELFPDPESDTRKLLLSLVTNSGSSIDQFKEHLESWYKEVMDRASGWYQRKIKYVLIMIGLGISITFNADTFRIAGVLSQNKVVTQALVNQATLFVQNPTIQVKDRNKSIPQEDSLYQQKVQDLNQEMGKLVAQDIADLSTFIGMGWTKESFQMFISTPYQIFKTILGWFITAIAISFGAPFWFDLLKNMISVRSSVPAKK
jgi:hypothetical protein